MACARKRAKFGLAAGAGVAGGLLGTLFGAGVGPIYVVYFNALRLEKEIFRVTMSTVVLLGGAARIAGYASLGFYERSSIALIAIGLPLVVVGSWLGHRMKGDGANEAGFGGTAAKNCWK